MQESEITNASLLVSCILCDRLDRPEDPLEFHPVCAACAGRYLMASPGMRRALPLNHVTIDEMVPRASPGTFALGYMDGGTFMAFYVGRSDSDLNGCLHDWVGMPSRYKTYAPSTKAACGLRHRGLLSLGPPTFRRVGSGVASAYSRFVFGSAGSSRATFDNECRDYHAFGGSDDGLDNEHHPVPPSGSLWECVVDGR
ncbi:MAG TPA: hypothetical protein VK714_00010 [Myxococcota bacterium]|nr:hypothetical protein [Myxococcota bacterium]